VASDLYCARSDVNKRLPLGAITSPAGIVASCLAGTDVITFDGHGLETDDAVTLRALEDGTLSAPLVAGTTYYAIRVTNATFKLSLTAAGAAIDITSDGVSMMVTREPLFDDVIEFYSRWADSFLPAHAAPLEAPIHPLVKGIVADLSAKRLLNIGGQDSEILNTAEIAAKAQLERFAKGIPLRGASATAATNKAVTSTLGSSSDARGWYGTAGSGTIR
jgi:hypothetical protein